ncbi:hypothetical protein TSOC_003878 [Tetrabaena socialis]|uniref:Tyrosine-protein kinase ephrin type A/B receptor-like domain-containing protein n=1 Tax=Tetrabaena socialis TaxID=47790 RepID=A0A2J8AAF0_9CHLO|nr:hypothetical protein TSOC_003878 [Tetrabaena socialis]|eukprot:PNH09497.1 hypothetical protein TSOC_003878 [Tetrabaena socialis]
MDLARLYSQVNAPSYSLTLEVRLASATAGSSVSSALVAAAAKGDRIAQLRFSPGASETVTSSLGVASWARLELFGWPGLYEFAIDATQIGTGTDFYSQYKVGLSIAVELLPCEVGTELELPSQAEPSSWTTCSTCRRDQLGLWLDQRMPVAAINTSDYLTYMHATNMQLLSNNGSSPGSGGTNRAFCLTCPADAVCPGGPLVVPKIGFWHSAANAPLIHRCPQPQACGASMAPGDAWHWHTTVMVLRTAAASLEATDGLLGSTAPAIDLDVIFSDNRSLALGLCQQLWHTYFPVQQLLVASRHNVSTTTFILPLCAMPAASTPVSLGATSYLHMQCATGYTGNLCATCKPGYSLNSDYQCTPCPAMPRTVGVGLLAFIGTIGFTLYTCFSNLGQGHADAMEAHAISSLDVLKVCNEHLECRQNGKAM